MADRYWRGLATDLWDGTAGTKWAATVGGAGGAAVPTAADDVFFDGTSANCTISGSRVAKSINCTGYTGTLAGASTPGLTISGSLTLVAGMTLTYAGTTTFNGTGTLTTAGKTLGSVFVNGAGITLTLGDALTSTGTLGVNAGTFTTSASNYSVTALILESSPSASRTINLNGSTVTLSSSFSVNITDSTNLTFNAGTSTINITDISPTLSAGTGLTFYNVSFTNVAMAFATITAPCTFTNLSVAGRTTSGLSNFTFENNQTITGTLTLSAGTDATMRTLFRSNVIGTARTLTCAAVASLTDVDFRDITIAGAAVSGGNLTGTRLGDCKGNSGITFTAASNKYWNLAAGGNWGGAIGWATSSGGTPNINNFPLAQDTCFFEATGLNSGSTISINAGYHIGTIDMSARTSNTMTLSTLSTTAGQPTIYGSWTNGTGVTLSGGGLAQINFAGRNTQNITSNGRSFTQRFNINSPGGSVVLLDSLTSTNTNATFHNQGTFNLNGFTATFSAGFSSAVTTTRSIVFGSGTLVMINSGTTLNTSTNTGLTVTGPGTISVTNAAAKSFAGGGFSFTDITLNQGGAGALTISGSNTFGDITNSYASTGATSILFTAGTTTTFGNWSASGTSGKLLTIGSSTTASHTLSKASGTVSANFLSISRSTATGGASWYAGLNSTDGGNNSGWIFSAPPSTATGNFFFMFYP